MMKKTYLLIIVSIMLVLDSQALYADNDAHQIQLLVVENSLSSDDGETRDGADINPTQPTNPTQFSATINGHVLSVGIPEPPAGIYARLRVNNSSGNNVVDRRFRRTIVVNIANTGYYTLILNVGSQTLQGEFEITD